MLPHVLIMQFTGNTSGVVLKLLMYFMRIACVVDIIFPLVCPGAYILMTDFGHRDGLMHLWQNSSLDHRGVGVPGDL